MKRILLALAATLALTAPGLAAAQKTTYLTLGAEYDLGRDLTAQVSLNTPAVNVPNLGNLGPLIQARARTDLTSLQLTAYLGVQLTINPDKTAWAIQLYALEKPVWTLGAPPEFVTAIGVTYTTYTTAVPALILP